MTRVDRIETYVKNNVCVVRVRTDDGAEGFGQTAPGQPHISAEVLHSLVARHVLGHDPAGIGAIVDDCARTQYKYWGSFFFRALGGVDTALWDLAGKVQGRPVFDLLGGKVRDNVPVYASSMSRETTPEAEAERLAGFVAEHGFGCVKAKIGKRVGRDGDAVPGRTAALVPLLRSTLGDDIEISADANGSYSPAQAVRIGRMLEEYSYYHLEEPNPAWELDNMGRVAADLDIPVGAGEQEFSLEIIWRMVSQRLVDVIQPDICYIGGLTRAKRVAELAELAGIPCTPHCSNRSMVQVFTAHYALAMPAVSQFQEWSIEDHSRAREIYEPVPVVANGVVEVGDAPGWGVEVPESFLSQADYRVSKASDSV